MKKSSGQYWDETWNPIVGCPGPKASPGCQNCWAENLAGRFHDHDHSKLEFRPEILAKPLEWKRPRRIFVCNTADILNPWVSLEAIDRIMDTIYKAQQHTFIFCTKRPENLSRFLPFELPHNLELGISGCNQAELEQNLNDYFAWAFETDNFPFLWLSLEPMLGPITLDNWLGFHREFIDRVVIGCESGPHRRPCKIEWVENLVDQCRENDIAVWVKQLDLKGECVREIGRFPKHLQIRELYLP
ncbi:MAG: DUF5131 family protein [Desulfobacteraceae bacterium]|nr:MAG: DUF5131 family protein [Desulfobacteraceae bacterium]